MFESVCGDFVKLNNNEAKHRVTLQVVKEVEFVCNRSWKFICRPAVPVPDKFIDELLEWRDADAILAPPKMGIIQTNDNASRFLACLRRTKSVMQICFCASLTVNVPTLYLSVCSSFLKLAK